MSLLLAIPWLLNGFRCLLDCHYTFPYEDQIVADSLAAAFPDCVNNPWTAWAAAHEGHYSFFVSVIRLYMVTCTHVADFYASMKFVFFADTMMMYVMQRTGWSEMSPFYKVFMISSLLYELYVLLGARRAYDVRVRQKTAIQEERENKNTGSDVTGEVAVSADFYPASLAFGVIYIVLGLRSLLFCDTVLPFEGNSMKDIFHGMYPACRTAEWERFSSGFVALVYLLQGALDLQIGTTTMLAARSGNTLTMVAALGDLYHTTLLSVFSMAVYLMINVRAGFRDLPLFYQLVTIGGISLESFALYQSYKARLGPDGREEKEKNAKTN